MTKRQVFVAGILAVYVVLTLSACEEKKEQNPPKRLMAGECPSGSVCVALAIDAAASASNACMQNGVEGGNAVVTSSGITWVAPTANTSLAITLQAKNGSCGFSQCSFSGTGSVASGTPSSSTPGTVVQYSTITIGGTQCSPGQAGLVMR